MLTYHWKVYILLASLLLYPINSVALNLSECFLDMTDCAQNSSNCTLNISNTTALSILLTSKGQHVTSTDAATAFSLPGCTAYCGTGEEEFSWYYFAQGYATWLLPYLALVSQLPFGSQRRMDNLMSAILTLGSPTLAGYSLYMTLLNSRWVNNRAFAGIDYPSAVVRQSVVRVLSGLQQVPLRIHPGESGHFESLVVLPDNENWWCIFAEELDYSHRWSIASATSITWVTIAYLLTVSNAISVDYQGGTAVEGIGSGLLGLLPIVVGWLVLSPKCNYHRVHNAYRKANRQVFAADPGDPDAAPIRITSNFGLTIHPSRDQLHGKCISSPDELRIPPVFNYSRVFSWYQNVYLTSLYYHAAWQKSNNGIGVNGKFITGNVDNDILRASRLGTREQTIGYCLPNEHGCSAASVLWPPGLFFNMVVASLMSLLLQWGVTWASVISFWFTPAIGLGCQSFAYLIYGTVSTVVWALLVSSSMLGYYAHGAQHSLNDQSSLNLVGKCTLASNTLAGQVGGSVASNTDSITRKSKYDHTRWKMYRTMSRVADWLRWTGKSLAIANAIAVIANCIFQYTGLYTSCYCTSNVFVQGLSAWVVIFPTASDIHLARSAWIGGVGLSSASCLLFMASIYLVRDTLPA